MAGAARSVPIPAAERSLPLWSRPARAAGPSASAAGARCRARPPSPARESDPATGFRPPGRGSRRAAASAATASRRTHLGCEDVAFGAHGLDEQRILGIVFDFTAQAAHLQIDAALAECG